MDEHQSTTTTCICYKNSDTTATAQRLFYLFIIQRKLIAVAKTMNVTITSEEKSKAKLNVKILMANPDNNLALVHSIEQVMSLSTPNINIGCFIFNSKETLYNIMKTYCVTTLKREIKHSIKDTNLECAHESGRWVIF